MALTKVQAQMIGGGTGSAFTPNTPMYENTLVVSTSYTLTTANNALSVGPITISSGVTVTVPSGQRWLIL